MKNEEEVCAVVEEQFLKTVPVSVHHMAQYCAESAAKMSQPLQGFFRNQPIEAIYRPDSLAYNSGGNCIEVRKDAEMNSFP